jgi:IclR family acetate operon transcriptional repressor
MHTSGIGKAILSHFDADRVRTIFEREGETRFTDRSLGTLDALAKDLADSRARGYAVDNEERTVGMRCIAAPIFDPEGEAIAGLSISGPVSRIPEDRVAHISLAVTEAAQKLTEAIGGTPQHPG